MGLVAGILIVVMGIIYIAYQAHREYPGVLTMVSVICVKIFIGLYVIPQLLGIIIPHVNEYVGKAILVLYIIVFIISVIYSLLVLPGKHAREAADESEKIWKEVNALPEPDQATLLSYREALGLPRYPVDDKTMNSAAREAWRRDQYNSRMKAKHKFVVHI